jgi:hypothetical protein
MLAAALGALALPACSQGDAPPVCQSYSCTNTSGGSSGNPNKIPEGTVEELGSQAELLFGALLPDFQKACAGGCHDTAVRAAGAPLFLAGPKPYDTIRKNATIVRLDYPSSIILTQPQHSGPAIDNYPELSAKLVAWLRYEAAKITGTVVPSSDSGPISPGAVSWSIGSLDPSGKLKDAKITATAKIEGTVLILTDIKVVAPAGVQGVHIVQPRFVWVPATGPTLPDVADSFSNLDMTAAAGASEPLGTGTAFFTSWKFKAGDKVRVEAKKVEDQKPAVAGSGPKCRNVAMFKANIMPLFMGQGGSDRSCAAAGCHGGTQGSPDMKVVVNKAVNAVSDAEAGALCGNLLAYLNKANPAQSQIILKAATAGTNHSGNKLANAAAFTTAITGGMTTVFFDP